MRKQKKKSTVKNDKPFFFHLGNLLLITSLLMFFLIFYPVIAMYLFPAKITEVNKINGNYITIPKIHAQAPIIYNVDPYNQTEYGDALKRGVAQAKGTALPGKKETIFIFAHSSGNPFEITKYNTVFLRLGELNKNDEIIINKNGKIYRYSVIMKKVVWPTETKYLKQKKNQLIIQTCWPIGTSLKRLLVFAVPSN